MERKDRDELNAYLSNWARWILKGVVGGLGYPSRSTLGRLMDEGPTGASTPGSSTPSVLIGMSGDIASVIAALDYLGQSPLGRRSLAVIQAHYLGAEHPLDTRIRFLSDWLERQGDIPPHKPLSQTAYFERLKRAREAVQDLLWRQEHRRAA